MGQFYIHDLTEAFVEWKKKCILINTGTTPELEASFILYISQESSEEIDIFPTLSKVRNEPCYHIQSN